MVVIWKSTGQGMLKYNHTSAIQRVCYNPATLMLASCSEVGSRPLLCCICHVYHSMTASLLFIA